MGTKPRLSIGVYQNPRGGRTKESIKRYTDGISGKNRKYRTEISDRGKVRKIELKGGGMPSGQAAIAAKAPNKNDAKDLIKKKQNPMLDERFPQRKTQINKAGVSTKKFLTGGQAKGRGMGLQDESVKPGKVMKAKRGVFSSKSLHKNLMKSNNPYSDLVKTTAKGPKNYISRGGKSVTRIPLAGKATSVGSTTMKGMKFSDKAKMVDAGKINKATGKFTSMEALRESVGFKPGETSSQFNKRKMMLEGAKKAAKANKYGKVALGVAAAGMGALQYLKSKMNKKKDNVKKKMGGGMMQRPMGYSEGTPKGVERGARDIQRGKKRQAGRPGRGRPARSPGVLGGARRAAGLGALGAAAAGTYKHEPHNMAFPGDFKNFSESSQLKEARKKADSTYEKDKQHPVKGKHASFDRLVNSGKVEQSAFKKYRKDTASNRESGRKMGGMMKPSGYRTGTMVKARGCKLGRTRPTKIT